MVRIADYFKLIKLYRRRLISNKDNRTLQNFQANLILDEIEKRTSLKNMICLEVGSSDCGYSYALKERCKKLIVSDVVVPENVPDLQNFNFINFNASTSFPIKKDIIDLIFCSGVIEHIPNPNLMLSEMYRILKKDGLLFLSFPPFYSYIGGHKFKPFHYLGEKCAINIYNKFIRKTRPKHKQFLVSSYKDSHLVYGLYILKISDVEKLLRKNNFKIIDKWAKFSSINFTKMPIFDEILTQHVCFLAQK